MTSLPYMQLYVSDYLADTAHLTTKQHGAYMLLLMNYWQRGKALDNNNERLSFVARLTPEEWLEVKEVISEFFEVNDSIWIHQRIEDDLAKIRQKSIKASFAGQKSVQVRAFNGRSTTVEQPLNHKEEDKEEDKDKNNKQQQRDALALFDVFWKIYPRKVAKQAAFKAFQKAILTTDPEIVINGAKRYLQDPNRSPTYTAHAATWLNAHRWLDEPLPPRNLSPEEKREKELAESRAKSEREKAESEKWFAEQRLLEQRSVPMPQHLRDLLKNIPTK